MRFLKNWLAFVRDHYFCFGVGEEVKSLKTELLQAKIDLANAQEELRAKKQVSARLEQEVLGLRQQNEAKQQVADRLEQEARGLRYENLRLKSSEDFSAWVMNLATRALYADRSVINGLKDRCEKAEAELKSHRQRPELVELTICQVIDLLASLEQHVYGKTSKREFKSALAALEELKPVRDRAKALDAYIGVVEHLNQFLAENARRSLQRLRDQNAGLMIELERLQFQFRMWRIGLGAFTEVGNLHSGVIPFAEPRDDYSILANDAAWEPKGHQARTADDPEQYDPYSDPLGDFVNGSGGHPQRADLRVNFFELTGRMLQNEEKIAQEPKPPRRINGSALNRKARADALAGGSVDQEVEMAFEGLSLENLLLNTEAPGAKRKMAI